MTTQDTSPTVQDTSTTLNENRLLDVRGLKKHFPVKGGFIKRGVGTVKAVDGVDLFVNKGETLGLVGESGCGKTTAGRTIMRLLDPTAGEIHFNDPKQGWVDLAKLERKQLTPIRPHIQIIFQPRAKLVSVLVNIGQFFVRKYCPFFFIHRTDIYFPQSL